MAKRAKGVESGGSVEGAIGGFAEDLGRILGQARNKADSWLGLALIRSRGRVNYAA